MSRIADLALIDYSEPAFQNAPFRWLAEKANIYKIARSERGVELLDYKLCRSLLSDRTMGTDHLNLIRLMGLPNGRALEFKQRMLLTQNRGETRKRLRTILSSLIGKFEAQHMRGSISKTVSDLLDNVSDSEMNLKQEFTDLVPAGVYCNWVNAPLSDARFVADMSETVLSIFKRDPSLTDKICKAYDQLFAYVKERIEQRKQERGEDFLSTLIDHHEAGNLSQDELEDFAVMLIEASTDNTSHQIAIAVDRLTSLPDIWQSLANNPNLVSKAVNEVMRLWPRSISTSRTALIDTEINGITIPIGTSVFASFGAAHRQSDIFNDPHSFQLNRTPTSPHMNFGGGVFSCLGQFVATIEIEEAVLQLATRYPNLQVINRTIEFSPMFQSVRELQVKTSG